ncbi:DUF2339 domain-containing protein [Psychrobacter sp. JCM 18903]|uniref:DUF2339 domain-containing protein n=2 Tax=Psychrobacter sp. JCM 18903 TaxID=1298610 RepID=UPI001917E4FE|nr:DUF2339 domain-containing protein [Psychrobacter sp. JCM 18903]
MSDISGFVLLVCLVVIIVFYNKLKRRVDQLQRDITQLQDELQAQQHRVSSMNNNADNDVDVHTEPMTQRLAETHSPQPIIEELFESAPPLSTATIHPKPAPSPKKPSPIEPDERSLPIVTSLIHSIKNWFFGGNLVVRVGVIVLLIGVVLLLRLLSDYIEVSIASKLLAIGILGLGLAALGLKLAKNRFAYGITLQGAGLAIAYLTIFFAYSVYQVLPNLPSFIGLGLLSAITIALAVRQNAFPLALLALSGGFFAPILTSEDTGSLVVLFSYYLLLNVTIAIIAHYRPWKILNLFGVTVTFGLAYYWGISENLSTVIEAQRWSLVLLVTLHLLLYLFVVIRYAQQIIAYNTLNEIDIIQTDNVKHLDSVHARNNSYVFPIDTGLLFSVPILAFGLFAALLDDIPNALTIASAILATVYLGLGWLFVQRSQRYALITEGMLALGFGFLALVIPLALDAEWIAFGWSVQGLALVWFGRRSLRAWSVLFALLLQLISIGMLMVKVVFAIQDYPTLALTISAISYLATMFILRVSNSPTTLNDSSDSFDNHLNSSLDNHSTYSQEQNTTPDAIATYANALGISTHAAQQWLTSVNHQSTVFNLVWHSPILIRFLTFTAIAWLLQVLLLDFNQWFASWTLATTTMIALAALVSLAIYWTINRYHSWIEIRQLSHGLSIVFYLILVLQLPQKFELNLAWQTADWLLLTGLIIGWLVIGQSWLKTWYDHSELSRYDGASWLGASTLIIAAAAHYGLAESAGVMAVLMPAILILAGLWCCHRYASYRKQNTRTNKAFKQSPLYWFDWQQALLSCAAIFAPIALSWVIMTNWSYDGVIWGLSYFPLLNLYDITSLLTLLVGFSLYYMSQHRRDESLIESSAAPQTKRIFTADYLLVMLGLISFWLISSMLVRTLHAFIGTPLWDSAQGGAWNSEQVQTGLTILWTLLALVATIVASRYWQRTLWFMGIGLLGVVVIKLVIVDLSQTEAIWRVISFLGAGSLILLIGYLAPLPPARDEIEN